MIFQVQNLQNFRALRSAGIWCLLVLAIGSIATAAETKVIRLRNEIIRTEAPLKSPKTAQALAAEVPVSGLFLVQFPGPLKPEWRVELARVGVTLLRYVPDDTFVAKFERASLAQVRALPFVHWVGAFRADHKVHGQVREAMASRVPKFAAPVRVLLAPGLHAADRLLARRGMQLVQRESPHHFGTVLEGTATPKQLLALANSHAVLWIEPAARMKLHDEVSAKIVGGGDTAHGTDANNSDGSALTPDAGTNHFSNVQSLGCDGRGVVVSVADSGLNNGDAASMHLDLRGRVDAFFYYGKLLDAADEHSHGTHCAGIVAGNGATGELDDFGALYGLGVAPGAHIIAQRIFDGVGGYEAPPTYETLTHDAVRAGAVIGSNSWGDDTHGRYDISAAEFDALVRDADFGTPGDQPYILEFSAGNAGPGRQTIGSPAVAKNVLATGAAQNNRFEFLIYGEGQEAMADFSSRGPAEDGRIKPDVVAPGTWIASLQSGSATDESAWSPISPNYQYQGGTSQAGPHASGAAAIFVQYFRETHTNATPSPALVKAALINSAVDMDDTAGTGPVPNMDEGWGRIDLSQMIGSPRRFIFEDQQQLLVTGQVYERRVIVGSRSQSLKITLTYTDVPGLPAAIPALVNDLDLEVIAPDGSVYHGNQFDHGDSVAGAPGFDAINNVEGVHLRVPLPGEYRVRVHARNVAEDARRDTVAVDQDFALVISGDIPAPGVGVVILDRTSYTAPATAMLRLIDFDLAGQGTAQVALSSTTETNAETITLRAFGNAGVFTGAVVIATGAVAADGKLQVNHGDTIQAAYQDAAGLVRTTEAGVDLQAPVISNVTFTNQFGRVYVRWDTDEAAFGAVRFGTNSSVLLSATNRVFDTAHEFGLDGLIPGVRYFFAVVSVDEAGNATTNNNAGALYTFVASAAKTILLVDAYTPDDPLAETLTIALSTYTDALAANGVDFEVWTTSSRGSPAARDLQPFRAVIWRLNDSPFSPDTLSAPQQAALTNYLGGGGSLLIASMELLTRLGDVPFRTNVLQVVSYATDVGVEVAGGVQGDPIGDGLALSLDYSNYASALLDLLGQSPDLADTVVPGPDAAPVFLDGTSGGVAGLRYPRTGVDSPGRLVFLPFPLDAVSTGGAAPGERANLLRRILGFLIPGLNGIGSVTIDRPEYGLPGLMTIEVADSDLAGLGQMVVTVSSDSSTSGTPVTLTETVRPGLFRGVITLVGTAVAAPGQLRAQGGDTVRVAYFDASGNVNVTASAVVDTTPPVITDVAVEADYEEAVVRWTTSEDADALVQFGESGFLNRTAYTGELDTAHAVRLTGLVPDRVYYFQIASRDAAGNLTTDDRGGKFYSFRTQRPLVPPYFDNVDTARTNWIIQASEIAGLASDTQWSFGVPNNTRETNSHTGTNAWGNNRNGLAIENANTDLISPAISLTGGNTATLRFWHSYDFAERSQILDLVVAGVLISTNNGGTWDKLSQYTELSDGWEFEELDLTPYVGRVIRLAWHYELFSAEAAVRPGWLIDDLAIEMTNVWSNAILISNNVAQAAFTVTGPTTFNGNGTSLNFTDAPAGQYVITFAPVAYYLTPQPQTNTLATNGVIVFTGNYTFPDVNNNGMSDLWELFYFGEVSATRTRATDTDGDGVTDYDEFIAGTDPTKANSALAMGSPKTQSNGAVRLEWASALGRQYRVQGSTNFVTWEPVTDWIRLSDTNSVISLPTGLSGLMFYRLEVSP